MNNSRLLELQLEMLEHAFGTLHREFKHVRHKSNRQLFSAACRNFKLLLECQQQLYAMRQLATLSDAQVTELIKKLSSPEAVTTEQPV